MQEKPKLKERESVMDYHEIIKFVENKYDIDVRDYGGKYMYQSECVIQTNELYSDTTWYNTARADATPEQIKAIDHYESLKPHDSKPYLDYWHWLLDAQFSDLSNGSVMYWNLLEILEDDSTPDWVKEITQKVFDEFQEHLDPEGGMNVLIEW